MKKEIIIIGGGTAGASAFAYFSHLYKNIANVKMISSKEIPTVGVGEASVGHIKTFLGQLNLDPIDFLLNECEGNIKYGVHLKDWYKEGWPYFTPVGTSGYDVYDYLHFGVSYKDIFTSWQGINLALSNKAPFLKDDVNAMKVGVPKTINEYAFQFDAKLFAEKLIEKGKEFGGKIINDDISELISEEEDKISYAISKSGKKYTADLWIDCSGFHKLIKNTLGVEEKAFEDMNNNRAWATQINYENRDEEFSYLSLVECQAMDAGWRWQIGLKNRIGTGYVFSTDYISEESALEEFKNSFNENRIDPNKCHLIKFQTSCLKRQCGKNWLSVGLSSGFIEPLESTSIFLMHTNLIAFAMIHQFNQIPQDVQMLDIGQNRLSQDFFNEWNNITDEKINIFNNYTYRLFENTVNYIGAHYAVNKNNRSKYWTDWGEKREKYLPIINQGLITKDNTFFLRTAWSLLSVGNDIPLQEIPNALVGRCLDFLPVESADLTQKEVNDILNNIPKEKFILKEREWLGVIHHNKLIVDKFKKYSKDLKDIK